MRISNTQSLLTLLLISGALTLSGCNLPKPAKQALGPDETTTVADFYIDRLDGSILTEIEKANYSLATSRQFSLQACVKDVARAKVIQNQMFKVEGHNETFKTDLNGCVTWNETLEFNPLLESKYILLSRKLIGTGLFKGTQNVEFAVDPWGQDDKGAKIIDIRRTKVPNLIRDPEKIQQALFGSPSVMGNNSQTAQVSNKLWVEDGRIFITEQALANNGMKLQVEMKTVPTIQMKKMNGDLTFRPIMNGKFAAQLSLIHKVEIDGKEVFRELIKSEKIINAMSANSLSLRSLMTLEDLPTRGQIFLGLRLEIEDKSLGLAPFEGMYLVGEHDRFKGTFFARLASRVTEEKNFRLQNLMTPDAHLANIETLPYQKARIEVAPLEFRFLRVGKETTTSREAVVLIRACLRNGADQNPIRSHTFKVRKFSKTATGQPQEIDITTDNNSCLNWDETIQFKYFACQHFIPGEIQISSATLGMSEQLPISINPWDAGTGTGRDHRYVQASEKIITTCQDDNRLRSQMYLDGYSYNTLSYSYEIDDTLNLSVKKKVLFKVEPKVLIYSNLSSGRGEIQRLRDGLYLLKVAVVKNKDYDQKNTYVTHDQIVAPALNGVINAEMTFKTNDLKALGNRNTILIEVFPLDEEKYKTSSQNIDHAIDKDSGLDAGAFEGVIVLNTDDLSRSLRPTTLEKMKNYFINFADVKTEGSIVSEIVREGQQQQLKLKQKRQQSAKAEEFAQYSNLSLVRLNDTSKTASFAKLLGIQPSALPNGGWVGSKTSQYEHLFTNSRNQDLKGLAQFIGEGRPQAELAQQLCAYWFYSHMPELHAKKGLRYNKVLAKEVVRLCMKEAARDPHQFFLTEKRLIVNKVNDFKFTKGFNQGISVGTSFSLSNSHSNSISRTASLSTKVGFGHKFFDIISVGADASYQVSSSTSDSKSESNSISVGAQASMAVQINQFEVTLGAYEQCAVVRLNPLLFVKDTQNPWWSKRRNILFLLDDNAKEQELAEIASAGFMFCSGAIQKTPLKRTETYYLINQDQSQTAMQDNSDERNRNFFMALRGKEEFNRFLTAIKSESKIPGSAFSEDDSAKHQLSDIERAFTVGLPIFPGNFVETLSR